MWPVFSGLAEVCQLSMRHGGPEAGRTFGLRQISCPFGEEQMMDIGWYWDMGCIQHPKPDAQVVDDTYTWFYIMVPDRMISPLWQWISTNNRSWELVGKPSKTNMASDVKPIITNLNTSNFSFAKNAIIIYIYSILYIYIYIVLYYYMILFFYILTSYIIFIKLNYVILCFNLF